MQLEQIALILEKIAAVEDAREYETQQRLHTERTTKAAAITDRLSSLVGHIDVDASKIATADNDILELLAKVAAATDDYSLQNNASLGEATTEKRASRHTSAEDAFADFCIS